VEDDDPAHKAFIDAIAEDPDDDTARLVYADWLDERGDPRAEYLRLEAELATSITGDRRKQATGRMRKLRRRLDALWLKRMSYDVILSDCIEAARFAAVRLIRQRTGLRIVDSVMLLEKAPCVIASRRTRDQARNILWRLENEWEGRLWFESRFVGWREKGAVP
jgi:uncharacterized protein (TIGR02996 family)